MQWSYTLTTYNVFHDCVWAVKLASLMHKGTIIIMLWVKIIYFSLKY